MKIIIVVFFILINVSINAQVVVTQPPFPTKIATYYKTLYANLINNSGEDYKGVYLKYTIFYGKSSANATMIANGQTSNFDIPKTGLKINDLNADKLLNPIKEISKPPSGFVKYIRKRESLPPGHIKVCLSVYNKKGNLLGESCYQQAIIKKNMKKSSRIKYLFSDRYISCMKLKPTTVLEQVYSN